eukprot:61435_1
MFAHKGVRYIAFGWTAFIAENVVLSHNREYIIETIGEQQYHGVYSVLSSAACLSIAYGYFRYGRQQGPILNPKYWKPNSLSFRFSAASLQCMGVIGFSQNFPKLQNPIVAEINTGHAETEPLSTTNMTESHSDPDTDNKVIHFAAQCPIDWKPKDIPSDGIYGLQRVTRHPMLFALGFVGLGAALKTQFATKAIVMGGFMCFSLIGGYHTDYRHRMHSGGYLSPSVEHKTSLIPFLALLRGRQNWGDLWNEIKHLNMVIGLIMGLYISLS